MQFKLANHTFSYAIQPNNTVTFLREPDDSHHGALKRNFLRTVARSLVEHVRQHGHPNVVTAKGEGVSETLPKVEARPRVTRRDSGMHRRTQLMVTVNHARAVLSRVTESRGRVGAYA
jgi:hypothetical protein